MKRSFYQILYFDWRVFFSIVYWNLRHISLRRFLFVILFIPFILILQLVILLFRLSDEIFFPFYRKTQIKEPLFIISAPRSGTTYLHSLFTKDENKYAYFLLYHTFFPSILFYKFIKVLIWIDSKIGWRLKRKFQGIEKWLFSDWEGIHPMGFESPEEDEGLFVLQMMSPAIGIFCPWAYEINGLSIADHWPKRKRRKMMDFYFSSMQRFQYAWGKDKTLLVKNVLSTGRIESILDYFPDAKIVYPLRSPFESIPSMISMFTKPYRLLAPKIPKNSKEYRYWGEVLIDFYIHLERLESKVANDQLFICSYYDLKEDPIRVMREFYEHLYGEFPIELEKVLVEAESKRAIYVSKHRYDLEMFGMNSENIREQLSSFFERHPNMDR